MDLKEDLILLPVSGHCVQEETFNNLYWSLAIYCAIRNLCRINLRPRWARAQGPVPRGAPHLEYASQNFKKENKTEREKKKDGKNENK